VAELMPAPRCALESRRPGRCCRAPAG
jgi:hypothetical protein